jgi:hypothetical protein
LKPSGNHKAPLPAKFDQVRPDGEMDNSPGPAFAPDIVDTRDKFAERQVSLPAITFHGLKYKPGNRVTDIGYNPMKGVGREPTEQPTNKANMQGFDEWVQLGGSPSKSSRKALMALSMN